MKIFVFGATGSIGREVVRKLNGAGHFVFDTTVDVTNRTALEARSSGLYEINAIIYAVGRCPPGGFEEAVKYPLSQLPLETYLNEIGMHQLGVLNVFQCLLRCLQDGGCFVFLSSAITRLKGKFPSFLQAHYHASVISAEDWLVEGMRHDPAVAGRKIKIHRLAPAAVDTPFHHGGPQPPKLIPISVVVDEVVRALESDEHVDKEIL